MSADKDKKCDHFSQKSFWGENILREKKERKKDCRKVIKGDRMS
jgi:hypothetical protein